MNLTECSGNGLTRCMVCSGAVGCETWCPKHTLILDESDADKARRMRVCQEIIMLRVRLDNRDAEIARLTGERDDLHKSLAKVLGISSQVPFDRCIAHAGERLAGRLDTINRLEKVADAAKTIKNRMDGINVCGDLKVLFDVLAELGSGGH